MPGISVAREVAAPAERTWAVATNLAAAADLLSAVTAIERLDEGSAFGAGTRWRETRRMFGREATEEMAVTAIEPGRSYTVEADGAGAHYVSVLRVDPLGPDRSRLEMTFEGRAKGLIGRLLAATIGRLAAGATRRALAQDLADIAAAAERAP